MLKYNVKVILLRVKYTTRVYSPVHKRKADKKVRESRGGQTYTQKNSNSMREQQPLVVAFCQLVFVECSNPGNSCELSSRYKVVQLE